MQVFTNGKMWSYDPKSNAVTVWQAEGPFGYNPSGFSLAATARDIARWGWHDRIRIARVTRANGRPAREVLIERANETNRELLVVDSATDLPVRMLGQHREGPRWVTDMVTEYSYNRPLPPGLFVPKFPASARVIDRDAGRRDWEQRLSMGIARQRVGDRTIAVRAFAVYRDGDIFLLYTSRR